MAVMHKARFSQRLAQEIAYTYFNTYTTAMMRKLTITVDEDVYRGLHTRIGPRRISRFLNDLARPLVSEGALEEGYRQMAADEEREREAFEWSEAMIEDIKADD